MKSGTLRKRQGLRWSALFTEQCVMLIRGNVFSAPYWAAGAGTGEGVRDRAGFRIRMKTKNSCIR